MKYEIEVMDPGSARSDQYTLIADTVKVHSNVYEFCNKVTDGSGWSYAPISFFPVQYTIIHQIKKS